MLVNSPYINRFCLIILCLFFTTLNAKSEIQSFSIRGKICVPHIKTVELLFIKSDSRFSVAKKIVSVEYDSTFSFEGKLPFPFAAYLLYNDSVRSEIFFIDPGNYYFELQTLRDPVLLSNSSTNQEYRNMYLPGKIQSQIMLDNYVKQVRDLKALSSTILLSRKLDSIIKLRDSVNIITKTYVYNYSKQYRGSYVSFWMLYFDVIKFGYQEVFNDTYRSLPYNLQSNPIGQNILANLKQSLSITVNRKFPEIEIMPLSEGPKQVFKFEKGYTLIDFWFSTCVPCLRDMSAYKEIYVKYHSVGFQIFGISIDSNKDLWKRTVANNGFIWPQFLDSAGYSSNQLGVNAYPTTFLVNDRGLVIKKNLSPNELTLFLKENLIEMQNGHL